MKIKQIQITVRDLTKGYEDNGDNGVKGYGGLLDIRPPYQREFIYGDKQRDAVITTILAGFPLNVMYWAKREDGTFEIIDGQQRTVSVCQYVHGDFSYDFNFFENQSEEVKEKILSYPLMVYVCEGTTDEKLKWFETINIPGAQLTPQELRNAAYAGPFVTDAKRYFSKNGCPAQALAKDLVAGSAIRQEIFETALRWICAKEGKKDVRLYMAAHQHDTNATQLWGYFQTVCNWAANNFFVEKRKTLTKGLDWGYLYEHNKGKFLDKGELERRISALVKDSEVSNKKGIIPFVLSGDERLLGLRTFGDDIREEVYEEQGGVCPICGEHFEMADMEADHIVPWCKGGKTVKENCQMLCMPCNRKKSGK